MFFVTSILYAQNITVTGTVSDETGESLPGATVVLKGTTQGVTTDFDGNYSIQVPSNGTLIFSFIGYSTVEIPVENKTSINVPLETSNSTLEEVVIVGYGTQKKSSISGSITRVEMDEVLGDRPVTTASTALQGIAPGLQVINTQGQPGRNNTALELRGFGSINNATPPLILVDNVEMSLSDINPNDIKDITVLKDAAAASIYGARGAWGVILISTKKAKRNQKISFDYRSTISYSSPVELPEKPTILEFVTMLNTIGIQSYWSNQNVQTWLGHLEAYRRDPSIAPEGFVRDPDGFNYPVKETYPIEQLLDDNGLLVRHDFSYSGGSEKSSYRVSASYSEEDGIVITDNDSFTKYNII